MPSPEEVHAARTRFRAEWRRFEAARDELLKAGRLRGRWVVFLDGEVKHDAEDRLTAHRWAVAHLDRLAGFVVSQIEEPHVYRVGGARRATIS